MVTAIHKNETQMSETVESIAEYLIALAADLRSGKPIASVLDELDDAIQGWHEEFSEAYSE